MLSSISFWLLLLEGLTRLIVAIGVVYRRRPVAVTLAWLVLLAFVPVISTALYLLVGENRLGSRRIERYRSLTLGLEQQAVHLWTQRCRTSENLDSGATHIARFGTGVSGLPPLSGNRMSLMPDNQTMLESLIRDIDSAKHHVHMVFYIFELDSGGERVGEALIRAAQRGVQCRLLVDGVGSWSFIASELWYRMIAAGVQCVEALRVNIFRRPLARLDLRNHRKIAVFDGKVAYCGSQNIHDVSFRASRWRSTGPWIDASVRVDGPAAQALAVTFLKDWQLDSDEDLSTRLGEYLPDCPVPDDGDCVVQVVPSGPGPTPMAIHQAFLTLIYSAREELVMCTPYFVPDEATLSALMAAASRGVRVTLVMPLVSDSLLVAAASRSHYHDLLEAGVQIHHYTKGLLHAKTLTVDRSIGLIGSANFDARSFFLNFEITLLVYDANFTVAMRQMQLAYLRDAHEVLLADWHTRPWWRVMGNNIAQLLGPLL